MADMVPHKIEPAKGARRALDDVARKLVLPQIADQREGTPARGIDLSDDGLDAALVDVGDPDRRAFLCEAQRAGSPHA